MHLGNSCTSRHHILWLIKVMQSKEHSSYIKTSARACSHQTCSQMHGLARYNRCTSDASNAHSPEHPLEETPLFKQISTRLLKHTTSKHATLAHNTIPCCHAWAARCGRIRSCTGLRMLIHTLPSSRCRSACPSCALSTNCCSARIVTSVYGPVGQLAKRQDW